MNELNHEAVAAEEEPLQPTEKRPKPTDDEIGDGLIENLDGNYRYFHERWHKYEGGVWTALQGFERVIWEHLKTLKYLGVRPTANKVSAIEKYLREYLRVEDDRIDCHDYINLKNGLFDVETMALHPHRRDVYFTSQLAFTYDQTAGAPTFQKFLNDVIVKPDGETDWQMQLLVLEALGYSLSTNTDMRSSFWLYGESGTGKSVLLNVLQAMAGNSHITIDLDEMNKSSYQMADVAGKRVVTFTEPRANSVLADNHYKRLVSQDTVSARPIYGRPFSFVPICTVWGAMNELPRVVDRSDAVFNRVIIIPMNRRFLESERDPNLTAKLLQEMPGIFNLALVGLKRLRRAGQFTRCEQSERAREEYRTENDIEAAFVADWCTRQDDAQISGQQLYDAYSAWCRRNGVYAKSSVKVARDWTRLGFQRKRSNGTWYVGVKLNAQGEKYVSL